MYVDDSSTNDNARYIMLLHYLRLGVSDDAIVYTFYSVHFFTISRTGVR